MLIAITDRRNPFVWHELSSDEFVQRNAQDSQAMGALQNLISTGEQQYLGEHFILHLPPQESDPRYYTCYNMAPAIPPVEEREQGEITRFELEALKVVDAVEMVSDPLSKSNVARMALRLGCTIARAIR